MYSGNDSTESQNYTQWALNPSSYNNVANDQVDWAALAQQWIIMKEAGPPIPDQMPTAPPPPNISSKKKEVLNEGGEAPMDVENDKEDDWNDNDTSWNWQQQQQQTNSQWNWNSSWSVPAGVPPPPNALKAPLLPTPSFNQFAATENESATFQNYNSPQSSNEYSSGYWTAAGSSKVIKPHNKRYSKVNVPVPVSPKQSVVLDAAKRKQLPAWIREGNSFLYRTWFYYITTILGLEKMEKEKQKQLDKEREKQVKQEYEERLKLSEKETMDIIKSTVKERSKFVRALINSKLD